MKNRISTILLFLMLFVGLSLLLYPTVSDYWNSFHQSRAIAGYAEAVKDLSKQDYDKIIAEAQQYNTNLLTQSFRWKLSAEQEKIYNDILNISGNGVMGYIEIPKIDVTLPIYHGTKDSVLQIAVGHVEGSSFPIGGRGTHAVISGHRGLPSAKLFTHLDEVELEDTFIIRILDEVYTYEVDRILIVEPDDMSGLEIDKDMDFCTLVTCTPYAVNTHRMLVRGHRIENSEKSESIRITADATQIEPIMVAPAVAAPILLVLFIIMMVSTRKKKDK